MTLLVGFSVQESGNTTFWSVPNGVQFTIHDYVDVSFDPKKREITLAIVPPTPSATKTAKKANPPKSKTGLGSQPNVWFRSDSLFGTPVEKFDADYISAIQLAANRYVIKPPASIFPPKPKIALNSIAQLIADGTAKIKTVEISGIEYDVV